jgi:DNA-nicking Smr family endonuclease
MTDLRTPFRLLSDDELELWTAVTADVRPFRVRTSRRKKEAEPAEAQPRRYNSGRAETTPVKPEPPLRQRQGPSDIDHRTRVKLRRGRLEVDAKLDLHGYRQAEAHRALIEFLRRAQAAGAKMAIIVTGKGQSVRRDDLEQPGVLRRMTPIWLQAPGLRDVVASFGEASRHHGGEGALYVQIRRAIAPAKDHRPP